jgi:hypothetical protein
MSRSEKLPRASSVRALRSVRLGSMGQLAVPATSRFFALPVGPDDQSPELPHSVGRQARQQPGSRSPDTGWTAPSPSTTLTAWV